jgi:hypothetical protein
VLSEDHTVTSTAEKSKRNFWEKLKVPKLNPVAKTWEDPETAAIALDCKRVGVLIENSSALPDARRAAARETNISK